MDTLSSRSYEKVRVRECISDYYLDIIVVHTEYHGFNVDDGIDKLNELFCNAIGNFGVLPFVGVIILTDVT